MTGKNGYPPATCKTTIKHKPPETRLRLRGFVFYCV